MTKRLVVIKLSGSLFSSENFGNFAKALQDIVKKDRDLFLILIAGGGATARKYIEAGSKIGLDQATLDELGIEASRLNAILLAEALSPLASKNIPKSLSSLAEELELMRKENFKRIVVCGGLHPGQSTNAVGSLVAEKTRADLFINATDVEGVYDKDPREFKDAIKLETVTPERLSEILRNESFKPGTYDLMDPVALGLISRSKIPTKIVKCEVSVLVSVLNGATGIGTTVVFQP